MALYLGSDRKQRINTIIINGKSIEYTDIVYNDDDTITLTDKDGVVHIMECEYEDGRLTSVSFDGKAIELTYDGDVLVKVGKTAVDMGNAPKEPKTTVKVDSSIAEVIPPVTVLTTVTAESNNIIEAVGRAGLPIDNLTATIEGDGSVGSVLSVTSESFDISKCDYQWQGTRKSENLIPQNMNEWTRNEPAETAYTNITYDETTTENICSYTGVGMFETIGCAVSLVAGVKYIFSLSIKHSTELIGAYEEPFQAFIAFIDKSFLSLHTDPYINSGVYSYALIDNSPKNDYVTYSCEYTPTTNQDVAVALHTGCLQDGEAVELNIKDVSFVSESLVDIDGETNAAYTVQNIDNGGSVRCVLEGARGLIGTVITNTLEITESEE